MLSSIQCHLLFYGVQLYWPVLSRYVFAYTLGICRVLAIKSFAIHEVSEGTRSWVYHLHATSLSWRTVFFNVSLSLLICLLRICFQDFYIKRWYRCSLYLFMFELSIEKDSLHLVVGRVNRCVQVKWNAVSVAPGHLVAFLLVYDVQLGVTCRRVNAKQTSGIKLLFLLFDTFSEILLIRFSNRELVSKGHVLDYERVLNRTVRAFAL